LILNQCFTKHCFKGQDQHGYDYSQGTQLSWGIYFIWENKTQMYFLLIRVHAIIQEIYQSNSVSQLTILKSIEQHYILLTFICRVAFVGAFRILDQYLLIKIQAPWVCCIMFNLCVFLWFTTYSKFLLLRSGQMSLKLSITPGSRKMNSILIEKENKLLMWHTQIY
jgi:hypothetical protein